jgi:predicted acetyltransferase
MGQYNGCVVLELRRMRPDDEAEVRAAQQAMEADNFPFALSFEQYPTWAEYLARLDALSRGTLDGWVREDILLADVDGFIVGRVSIRYELDELLAHEGGHIGYCVLPAHRRRGYATEMLRQSVALMQADGVDRILVTCDDDNVASARVIERGGGVFESIVEGRGGIPKRRYWIG